MKSCWIVVKDHKAALEWRDVPVPQPKANEIVVRVRATRCGLKGFLRHCAT